MKLRYISSALLTTLVITGCDNSPDINAEQQQGPDPILPTPQNFLIPPMKVPKGVGWEHNQSPKVVEGLKIEKIADGLLHPRQLLTLPNGDILVVEANSPGTEALTTPKQMIAGLVKGRSGKGGKGGNRITLLRPAPDGSWTKFAFLDGLNSPFGVQLIGNMLYVANTDSIMQYVYQSGETHITDPGTELTDLPGTINHHWTKSLLASPDGKKLYVGVGSNSNITENGLDVEYRRASVLEVDVASGASRIFASGLRNPTGLQWEPENGKLWVIVNERDEIGAELVPDYLTSVSDGSFYGWPYSYYGQHIDSRAQPQRPDLVSKAIKPDYAIGSHVAPLGLLFYSANALPSVYHGGVFISEHGSWDRSPISGYQVSYITFEHGKPTGKPKPIVTGFVSEDEKQLHGAPVGLAMDKTGALLIADDVGNTVWRVSAE
jgi:glucose/arabinose dehydrogenase